MMRSVAIVVSNGDFEMAVWRSTVLRRKAGLWYRLIIIIIIIMHSVYFLSDFDRASSLICGNKCQLDATDVFYCRSYCLLNMFRAPLCSSSGAREYYTDGRCL